MQLVVLAATLACALAIVDPIFPKDYVEKRHLRHRHHAQPGLLKFGHHINHLADLEGSTALEDAEAAELVESDLVAPMALPGRHPSVEKALAGMSGDLVTLKEEKLASQGVRQELEGTVTDAVQHMNDATTIKQAMVKKQNQLRVATEKLKTLERDAAKLGGTKSNLVSSLRRMLGPKVMFARERFEKKEAVFQKEAQATKLWREKKDQLHEVAMDLIKHKHATQQSLLEAEHEVEQAKKKAEMAKAQYEHDSKTTAEKVQSYRYAETRAKAEEQHEKAAKAAALAAHESVEKLHRVYEIEQEKVEQSINFRKDRLEHKIHQIEEARTKSKQELERLSQQYKDWQESQRERTAEVVKKSQETAAAQESFANDQQKVLDSASKKVARSSEGVDDWDDWGGDSFAAADETDDF